MEPNFCLIIPSAGHEIRVTKMKIHPTILWLTLFALTSLASGADSPQWRGPNRDGHSSEKGLLKEWPKEGPKLLWQISNAGSGYSTAAVVGERIYLLSSEGLENESVRALSANGGAPIWASRLGKVGNPQQKPSFPAARSTPTVEGERIYALSSDGDLVCLETSGGK